MTEAGKACRDGSIFRQGVPIYINRITTNKENKRVSEARDLIEISYVYKGKGRHLINGDKYIVSKGDICILHCDTPSSYVHNEDDSEGSFIVYSCVFRFDFLEGYIDKNDFESIAELFWANNSGINEKPVIMLKASGAELRELDSIFEKMMREYDEKLKGYVNVLRSGLVELITKIYRIVDSDKTNDKEKFGRNKIIKEAVDFLQENYFSPKLSINEVALKSYLSRTYFSRIFKEATGVSYTEYLQNIRITEACRLLKNTDNKITDIMFSIGFRDIKHFNKLFKRITGMTPSEYRKYL